MMLFLDNTLLLSIDAKTQLVPSETPAPSDYVRLRNESPIAVMPFWGTFVCDSSSALSKFEWLM